MRPSTTRHSRRLRPCWRWPPPGSAARPAAAPCSGASTATTRATTPARRPRSARSSTHGYRLNPKGQVRYLAYNGLTYFRLGQTDSPGASSARPAPAYRSGDPAWLPPEAVVQMDQALDQLSGGAAPPPPPPAPAPAPSPAPGPAPDRDEPTNVQ